MKKLALIPALALAAGLLLSAHTAEARTVRGSYHHQGARIRQGVHSKALTRKEARKLSRRELMMRRRYAHARRTGGGLSWAERQRLERARRLQSARIYRQKHDRQRRH